MKNQTRTPTFFFVGSLLLAVILVFSATTIRAQEVEDEREFDYKEGGQKGPRMWGDLKKEWAACKNGKIQSPIDMSNERVDVINKSEKNTYKPSNAVVTNRGHDISIMWGGDAGSLFINGSEYALRQAHWHSPSEHTINGRRYDMELHMVHHNKDQNLPNKIAVSGVLYRIGKPDEFLGRLTKNISTMINQEGESVNVTAVDPREIKMYSKRYYRYMGSLTVPPCTEGVIWTIHKKVRTVSRDQMKLLREAVHDYAEENARPIQQKNSREIYLYGLGGIGN